MKRFAFPLESARKWRSRQLEVEESRLQELFAERETITSRRRALEQELQNEIMLLAAPALQAVQLAALDAFRRYVTAEKARIAVELHGCEQRIEAQRSQVLEARRKFELLNRLREKALRGWQAANARELENVAADLYLARCARER